MPRDVSVIGLDDIDFAEFTLPPLTTIRLSRAELARAAFEALRQQAEEPGNPRMQREFLVSTSLVVRGSTAPPVCGSGDLEVTPNIQQLYGMHGFLIFSDSARRCAMAVISARV